MTDVALSNAKSAEARTARATAWARLSTNRNWLGFWFMLPAAAFLILFLAYPLGSASGCPSPTPGSAAAANSSASRTTNGSGTTTFWLSVFNTCLYTVVASAIKFAVGLYLALLLNKNMPFKSVIRADRADPVRRADRAVGHRVLVDLRQQFSIISWSLRQIT